MTNDPIDILLHLPSGDFDPIWFKFVDFCIAKCQPNDILLIGIE